MRYPTPADQQHMLDVFEPQVGGAIGNPAGGAVAASNNRGAKMPTPDLTDETCACPWLAPLPHLARLYEDAKSSASKAVADVHPEYSGAGGCAAVVNSDGGGLAPQQQFPAASKTVSGERSAGACAAAITVDGGGSPQRQLATGIPRDIFPGLDASLPPISGPPAGTVEGQILKGRTIDVTIK
jgi:hypothetical protein